MKNILENLFGFLYTLSMGDYLFFFGTLILIMIFIYFIFILKKEDVVQNIIYDDSLDSLSDIKDKIEKEYKPIEIKLTPYEEEQEKNAIISYDELLKNKDKFNVSYDENYKNDIKDVNIKKINITDNGTKKIEPSNLQVKLMNYDKEEEFLIALKQLQKNLIN